LRYLAAFPLAAIALAGCGGDGSASPESVTRAWSKALNSGDNQSAADLFAPGAEVVQSGQVIVLRTRADALRFNSLLPCSGKIVSISTKGNTATATFLLGNRKTSRCDAPGAQAVAAFTVHKGKIVLWHQLPTPEAPKTPAI
jgi:hypothetical protein